MTAASIELLTEAGAALLLRSSMDMDVIWSVLQLLGQDSKVRAVVLSCPENGSLSPVCPEDVLLEDSQGVRVHDSVQDDLSILTSQRGPLDLISAER